MSNGFTITGKGISLFGLAVLKSDLKLLKHGITRRGYNARTLVKQIPGCPKTRDLDKLIAFVEEQIVAAGGVLPAGSIVGH